MRNVDESEIAQGALDVITDLLDSGYAIVGDVVTEPDGLLGVRSWGLNTSDTVKRIRGQLRDLGRAPELGEVCWLELTEAGRATAR
jgi:hypothetical protein